MRSELWPAALIVLGISVPAHATRFVIPHGGQLRPVVVHPEREPRAFPRRWVELAAHGGGAQLARCDEPCEGVQTWGYAAGATALVRATPSFAWGFVVDWSRYGAGPDPAPPPSPGIDAVAQLGVAVTLTFGPPSR